MASGVLTQEKAVLVWVARTPGVKHELSCPIELFYRVQVGDEAPNCTGADHPPLDFSFFCLLCLMYGQRGEQTEPCKAKTYSLVWPVLILYKYTCTEVPSLYTVLYKLLPSPSPLSPLTYSTIRPRTLRQANCTFWFTRLGLSPFPYIC